MKRFDIEASCTVIPANGEMFERKDGDYVLYEDVQSQLKLLAKVVLKAHKNSCACCPIEDDNCLSDYKCEVYRNCQCPACVLARDYRV